MSETGKHNSTISKVLELLFPDSVHLNRVGMEFVRKRRREMAETMAGMDEDITQMDMINEITRVEDKCLSRVDRDKYDIPEFFLRLYAQDAMIKVAMREVRDDGEDN